MAATISAVALATGSGGARDEQSHPAFPQWWVRQALCIHQHEGAWDDLTGNGYGGGMNGYGGGMQFTIGTWNRVPGRRARDLADIARASIREQLRRAHYVWSQDGGSWREWPTSSRKCGLT